MLTSISLSTIKGKKKYLQIYNSKNKNYVWAMDFMIVTHLTKSNEIL